MNANTRIGSSFSRLLALVVMAAATQLIGCANSFLDPSKISRLHSTPTIMPILERIDAIETGDATWGQTSEPSSADLVPSDLTYNIAPGDVVTVRIFELYGPSEWSISTRRIDATGSFRVPELGDMQAAGLTAQEFEDHLREELEAKVMRQPQVDVVVEDGSGFTYTVYGAIEGTGLYTLRDPNLRIMDALAVAGGVPMGTKKVFVIRQVPLTEDVKPEWDRGNAPGAPQQPAGDDDPPVSIDDIIDRMDDDGGVSPGVMQDDAPPIDIDDLEPVRVSQDPAVDIDDLIPSDDDPITMTRDGDTTYVYDEEQGAWIRVAGSGGGGGEGGMADEAPTVVERVIEIDYQALSKGDGDLNVVIRPFDRIFVEGPEIGLVYIRGEILRPGVYNLPTAGRLTLTRLIATAGDLSQLAIPERVDLTRIVGPNRQATMTVNLAAIARGTEPDIYLKPDDSIVIGTHFWAVPLAVLRNGFRITYGFGFLLDRNFGNDVFGAPPTNFAGGG